MSSNTAVPFLAPFLIEPQFVERIWGTMDLRPWYDFVAKDKPVGEVWLTGDACRALNGPAAGKTLAEIFAQHSEAMLGTSVPADMQGSSPLLMKVIYALEKLSVQVHPDDKLAQKYGQPRGKTECWYALAAEPGAEVAAGLLPGVTLDQIEAEVAAGTLEQSLKVLPVAAGEMIFIDAGTVHAIWPGSVLLETQQNCDITYRLFDYGRPRELHVAKALEAIRLQTGAGNIRPIQLADRTVLIDRAYFSVEKIELNGSLAGSAMRQPEEGSEGLAYLFSASGSATIRSSNPGGSQFEAFELPKCGMVAIPASSPAWEITGNAELIRITPRWPKAEA